MATTYGGQLRSRYSPDHIVAKAIVVRKSVGGNTVPVQVRPRLLCKNKITQLVERFLPVRRFESYFYFYKMEDKRMASGHPGKVLRRRLVREAFARHDMDFIDCTVDLWREDRSIEILEWLQRNPQVEKFAVLDDDPDAGTNGLHDSFFKTSFDVGLTEDIANKIILHLNNTK